MGNIAKGFRDQQLSTTPRARSRLYNAQAAMLEQQMQPQTPSIIGGQFIGTGNDDAINAAQAGLRDRKATADAQRLMRQQMGSTTVTRGKPGGLGDAQQLGAGQIPATSAVNPSQPAMNGDAVYPGGPSFSSLMQPPGPDTTTGAPNNTFVSQQGDTTLRQVGSFFNQENPSPLRRNVRSNAGDSSQPTTLDSELDTGMRNGGMVNKQRMVKQPGYKSGGKVKMPGQPCGMRGYQRGGPVTDDWQYLENVDGEMREVPKPVVDRGERGFRNDPKASILTNTMRRVAHGAKQKSKKDDKSKDGMMAGGQIGDEMQDDGRDTVDVRVREGEYMLNPETVAAFGAGDYEAGASVLDGIVTATTGEQPGPTPVNEAGEEVQQGMRNGGSVKMGYAAGGQFDMFGNATSDAGIRARARAAADAAAERARLDRVAAQEARWSQAPQPESVKATEIPEGAREKAAKQNAKFDAKAAKANATKVKPGFRGALSGKHTTSVGDVFKGAGRSVKNVARGGPGLLRGTAPVAGLAGAWQGFQTPTEDYVERMGIDYPETLLGELGVRSAGVLSDVGTAFIDPFIELGNLATGNEVPTLRSNFADVQAADGSGASIPAQLMGANEFAPTEAGATAPPPPPPAADPYGRAFGAGNVDLNNAGLRNARAEVAPGGMNVVQNTGGPDGEVIVREDINGVPTFTNLRRGGFDGSPRNLQAQADARAAQDVGIRQMQAQAVEQMRQNAPVYGDQVEARRAETAMREQATAEALAKATAKGSSSLADMREAYTSMGLFTDPETGDVRDDLYNSFVDNVGAELAKEGININELPPQAMMVLASEYSMARDTSGKFNSIVAGETGYNPNALIAPQDVGQPRPATLGDFGPGNAGSNIGAWDSLRSLWSDVPVYDVNIPNTNGEKMTVSPDDLGFRDLRRKNYYEGN